MIQPVERKRKRTRKHGRVMLAAAAFVFLGASIAVFFFRPGTETTEGAGNASVSAEAIAAAAEFGYTVSPEEPENTRGTLQARQADELESVTITRRGEESWTLIRDDAGEMRLKGSEDWVVKERLASQIRDAMTNLVYEDILTEDPAEYRDRLADFGLDDPYIIAEAHYTDGGEITIRLGNEVPVEESVRYMIVDGDDRLYAAAHSLAEDLEVNRSALHPVTQPEIYHVLLDRITVYGRDGKETAEWRLRGAVTDQDAGTNWEVTAPFRYAADETFIRNLKTSAGNLRMGIFLDDATEENLADRGLDEPEYTLELHMATGSTGTVSDLGVYDVVERESGTITLQISRSCNEMIDYVRFGDEIFSVSHDLTLAAFLDTDPADTAARYIAPTPLNSLESLTIEKDGETVVYSLERTGETDPETAEERIICRRNGEEISRDSFEAAYERLLTVTVSGTLPENAQWKKAHTKYTFRAVSGGTHTVELSEWDGMHDAVTMDGETRFYLIEHGAEFTLATAEN